MIATTDHDPGAANDPPDPTAEELRKLAYDLLDGWSALDTTIHGAIDTLQRIANRIDGTA